MGAGAEVGRGPFHGSSAGGSERNCTDLGGRETPEPVVPDADLGLDVKPRALSSGLWLCRQSAADVTCGSPAARAALLWPLPEPGQGLCTPLGSPGLRTQTSQQERKQAWGC